MAVKLTLVLPCKMLGTSVHVFPLCHEETILQFRPLRLSADTTGEKLTKISLSKTKPYEASKKNQPTDNKDS